MHTTRIQSDVGEVVINHNSDWSGKARLKWYGKDAQEGGANVTLERETWIPGCLAKVLCEGLLEQSQLSASRGEALFHRDRTVFLEKRVKELESELEYIKEAQAGQAPRY